jgi:putative transcriptional regulator
MATAQHRLGRRLKKLRTARGISQATLATKAKITREYVNKLEAGQYDPTVSVAQRLARALKVTLAELVE